MTLIKISCAYLFADLNNPIFLALTDPLGGKAINQYTQYWTMDQKNNLLLPVGKLIVLNRLFWLGIAGLLFTFTYQRFNLNESINSFFRRKKDTRAKTKNDFGNIKKVTLPEVKLVFNFKQQLKTSWKLSNIEFSSILKSPLFLFLVLACLGFLFFSMSEMNTRFGVALYPRTWLMLKQPIQVFSGIINFATFLYAGVLIHRAKQYRMETLIDVTPIPNWVLLSSKFLALLKMQIFLLTLILFVGIAIQSFHGYHQYELGHYLFELYGLHLIHFVCYACLAVFIQSLFKNPYFGFFLLLLTPIAFISLMHFGPEYLDLHFLEQGLFRFNQGPGQIYGLPYSDMDGYGAGLMSYFFYKFYWLALSMILLLGTLLMWPRGIQHRYSERIWLAYSRFNAKIRTTVLLTLVTFLAMGFSLFYENNSKSFALSGKQKIAALKLAEAKYKQFLFTVQPKITAVNIDVNLRPEDRTFDAKGSYQLVNKTNVVIDTIIVNHLTELTRNYDFDKPYQHLSKDTVAEIVHFDILILEEPLFPGEELKMTFETRNNPQSFLGSNSFVKSNGTALRDDIFPRIGNWLDIVREMLHIPVPENKNHPSNKEALSNSYTSKDSDRINFEATISTSLDQQAIAPGTLQKSWIKNNRRYFHYKTADKIAHTFLFLSGDYGILQDKWNDIDLAVYYHKDHSYNIDRMMSGLKDGLTYCSANFSPYQYKELSIVEFAQTGGASAHGFPNIIPTGEEAGFLQHVCDHNLDLPYLTGVHETAHQWWGHQVMPADVLGAKMVVETMAEYISLQVLKKRNEQEKLNIFLTEHRKKYLQGRNRARTPESPLLYTSPSQNHIHYSKGALTFHTLSEFIGEQKLNKAIKKYVEKVAFQEDEYTTSEELLSYIQTVIPDSLLYLNYDLFKSITFYKNKMMNTETTKLPDGKYQLDIEFLTSKYRTNGPGRKFYSDNQKDSLTYIDPLTETNLHSLPLNDYIPIAVFSEELVDEKGTQKQLYLEKHKVSKINNNLRIVLDEKPTKVVLNPNYLLMEEDLNDNFWEGK